MYHENSNKSAKDRNSIRFDMSFSGRNSTYENINLFEKGVFFTPGMTTSTDKITGWSGNTLSHDLAYFMIEMSQILLQIKTITRSTSLMNDTIRNNTFADKITTTKIKEGNRSIVLKIHLKQNIWEGISVAAGKGLMTCHIDRGNFSQIGYNYNLSANQIIHDESYNTKINGQNMFNRMYVGTYSKSVCFHALNKSIQFNEILI